MFTSIPIIVLILTTAKDVTLQAAGEAPIEEHHLLTLGLRVALVLPPAMTWRLVWCVGLQGDWKGGMLSGSGATQLQVRGINLDPRVGGMVLT